MPQKRYRKKKSERHTLKAKLTYSIIATIFIILCFALYSFSHPIGPNQNFSTSIPEASLPKAAIIDQLSILARNQTFVQQATTILENASFTVDYHKGEDVTVEFYRRLPQQGYSLIVMRVHSGIEYSGNQTTGNVDLFTSEPYDEDEAATTYFWDAIDDRLVRVFFTEGGPMYFGISPKFVESSMNGRFNNTTIIMMGCDGLRPGYTTMAEAFVKRGAKVYIGWTGPVTSTHSDRATICLLQSLIIENQTIKNAIISALNEVGSDPAFHTELLFYPVEQEDYTVQINKNKNFSHYTLASYVELSSPRRKKEEEYP